MSSATSCLSQDLLSMHTEHAFAVSPQHQSAHKCSQTWAYAVTGRDTVRDKAAVAAAVAAASSTAHAASPATVPAASAAPACLC